jgi:3-hydroxyacyl-CoA dehydrogenase/enoyl-CoA hydratase/3-hydroxybutyryl-CoA epimerase
MNDDKSSKPFGAFSLEKRSDRVLLVRIDVPGEAVNTLQADFVQAFSRLLDDVETDDDVRAVVITSGKSDSFIAGADIRMLQHIASAPEGAELSRSGQRVLSRLATVRVPTVAAIHGPCLGGGLELALACTSRVASQDAKTKLGLPEVQLGILPGLGGTQRLPRLIGTPAALDMMLTGRQVDARRALRMGLVDEVVPSSILLEAAVERALSLAPGGARSRSPRRVMSGKERLKEAAVSGNAIGRVVLFSQAKKQLLAKTHGNYPAPEKILDVVKQGLERGIEHGLEAEARAFGELALSPQAQQLMNVFFATQELKKDTGASDPSVRAKAVAKVGVIGAGLMGAGIAYVTAEVAGIPVRLRDKDHVGLAAGLKLVRGLLDERVARRRMTPAARDGVMLRVTPTTDYSGFHDVDVVIEAVFEDIALKHLIVQNVEEHGSSAIFASNTSSLPISRIAEASAHPERVIGMHYFSPVHKMPLLEIVVTKQTADWVVATCVELGKKQGKTVIVVNDGVGFYTSRILSPYLNEAAFLLAEGVRVEQIDRALVTWGFPVGPLTLLDEVGVDVADKVGHIMHAAFGERMRPAPGLDRLVADKRLGKKNQRGFYAYGEQKGASRPVDASVYKVLGVKPNLDLPLNEIANRVVLQMVNEAARCYGEGVLRSARDGDVGAVFGLGFPPFRGGPLRFADAISAAEIVRRLQDYERRYGARFAPAPTLLDMARDGASFYPGDAPVERASLSADPRSLQL